MKLVAPVAVQLLLAAAACTSSSDPIGTYCQKTADGMECLELNSDGGYIHRLDGPSRTSLDKGQWTLQREQGSQKIVLTGSRDSSWNSAGVLVLPIQRGLVGRTKLFVDYDLNQYFEKTR